MLGLDSDTFYIYHVAAVMGMGIKKDMEVTITVEGDDEEQAAQAMKEFFEANL